MSNILYLCFLIPFINKNRFRLFTSKEVEVDINNRIINSTKCYNQNNDAALIPRHHIPINNPIWDRH